MTVFAGLDVHKKYFHATALEESGDVLVQKNYPNGSEGYDSLLAKTVFRISTPILIDRKKNERITKEIKKDIGVCKCLYLRRNALICFLFQF
ncbi:hypothetical protein AKJ57_06515 [candidate division MSBL1 archaeon SCGC-AAA259A05]|uniref:Uncharacterized protein n=1 Tax=candidate division MSBL1 archaeon SCGC-AAA259A05 TaxID=1698259 RepID=A0A133U398_9EURY|nr:hypothetical protein AKJ57_06515 [candidate division MSBL1 archaeon SCGC-AAA259A05]